MRIERKVELAVRRALAEAVAGNLVAFEAAVARLDRDGSAASLPERDLVFAIGAAALRSVHHGRAPATAHLYRLAKDFADYEEWCGVGAAAARAHLLAFAGEPTRFDPPETWLFGACAVTAWLLSAFIPDALSWTDFLDGVLDRLEARAA